jgi:hypothetical protein
MESAEAMAIGSAKEKLREGNVGRSEDGTN